MTASDRSLSSRRPRLIKGCSTREEEEEEEEEDC
jgi:hypothetical protein